MKEADLDAYGDAHQFILNVVCKDRNLLSFFSQNANEREPALAWLADEAFHLGEQMCQGHRFTASQIRRRVYDKFRWEILLSGVTRMRLERETWQHRLLYYFSRFCGPANRENIQLIQRDLILESRDMQKAQHKKWFIATALTWRAIFGGMLPIMTDGLWRLIKPVKEAKEIVKKSSD